MILVLNFYSEVCLMIVLWHAFQQLSLFQKAGYIRNFSSVDVSQHLRFREKTVKGMYSFLCSSNISVEIF